jgi:deoxycytidylate deaminase
MAKLVAQKSKDTTCQIGAVIADANNAVVSLGYNGPPRGVDDSAVPMDVRPQKYMWMLHAEENALWHAQRSDLSGCTVYVTGRPCANCCARIVHHGIRAVVFDDLNVPRMCDADNWLEARRILAAGQTSWHSWHSPLRLTGVQLADPAAVGTWTFVCAGDAKSAEHWQSIPAFETMFHRKPNFWINCVELRDGALYGFLEKDLR